MSLKRFLLFTGVSFTVFISACSRSDGGAANEMTQAYEYEEAEVETYYPLSTDIPEDMTGYDISEENEYFEYMPPDFSYGFIDNNNKELISDENGTWLFENGEISLDKTGFMEYNGFEYFIENGRSTDYGDSRFGVRNGRKTYLIGDSRTRQAYSCMYEGNDWKERSHADYEMRGLEIWKALGSTKLDYMSEALDYISYDVDNVTDVILLSGFNDLLYEPVGVYDIEQEYISLINEKAEEFYDKGANVYYVSVNPTEPGKKRNDGSLYNSKIEDWNAYMADNLDKERVRFIDTYNGLQLGDKTYDGIHYEKEANIEIINYVMDHKLLF